MGTCYNISGSVICLLYIMQSQFHFPPNNYLFFLKGHTQICPSIHIMTQFFDYVYDFQLSVYEVEEAGAYTVKMLFLQGTHIGKILSRASGAGSPVNCQSSKPR